MLREGKYVGREIFCERRKEIYAVRRVIRGKYLG